MSKSQEISRSRQQVSGGLEPSPKERLKRAKWDHEEKIRLAELKNERFDRICSLLEVLMVILAIIFIVLVLRNTSLESIKSTLALIASIVTVTGAILVGIRKYRRSRSNNHKSTIC